MLVEKERGEATRRIFCRGCSQFCEHVGIRSERVKHIKCPVCDKRVCDSDKSPKIEKLSDDNAGDADIVIKCKNCKACLIIRMVRPIGK